MGEAVAAAAAEFHAEEFPVPVGMPEGTTCNELPSWLQDAINDVVQGVIAEIPNHKTLSHLPVEAKVRVGMVDAEVRNLTVRSLQMSRITMAECRSPREGLASFVPKLLPDGGCATGGGGGGVCAWSLWPEGREWHFSRRKKSVGTLGEVGQGRYKRIAASLYTRIAACQPPCS